MRPPQKNVFSIAIHLLKKTQCCSLQFNYHTLDGSCVWTVSSLVEFCRTFRNRFSLDEMDAGSLPEESVVHCICSWLFSLTVDTRGCFVFLPPFPVLSQSVPKQFIFILLFFFQLLGLWNQKSHSRQLTARTTHGVYEARGVSNELKDRWPWVNKLVIAALIINWKEANRLTLNERSAFQ